LLLGGYNETESLSGPEKYAKRLFTILEGKYQVTFLTYFESGNYSLFKKLFGSENIQGKQNVIRLGIFMLIIHLLCNKYHIVHITSFSRFAYIAYFFSGHSKIVYTAHGLVKKEDAVKLDAPYFYKLKNRIAEKTFFNKSDFVVTLSPYLKDEIQQYYPYSVESHTIFPGIDEMFLHAQGATIKRNNPLRVLFLGGFAEREKAAYSLIEDIQARQLETKITCIGFSEYDSGNLDVSHVNKSDSAGWLEVLSSCDVFISPYQGETFSIASLEAMALGKIVIAAIHSGVAALIKNEVNGFAIDAHSQSQIPDILESIINGAVAVDDLSKNAVLSVKHLTWEYASEKHYQAYIDLYNLPKARAV